MEALAAEASKQVELDTAQTVAPDAVPVAMEDETVIEVGFILL